MRFTGKEKSTFSLCAIILASELADARLPNNCVNKTKGCLSRADCGSSFLHIH